MYRVLVFSLLVSLAPVAALAAPAPKPAPGAKAELAKLQGEWVMPSRGYRLTIKGDQWVVTQAKKGRTIASATLEIDPSKSPKQIDLKFKQNGAQLGIYKIEGDTLTLCRTNGGRKGPVERPREFKAARGQILMIWTRAKAAP